MFSVRSRIFHCASLALALTLASVVSVMADAAMSLAQNGLSTVVICSDEGAETITLDRSGNPVDPPSMPDCSHCPACMLHVTALPVMPAVWSRPGKAPHLLTSQAHAAQRSYATVQWRLARGPPKDI